MIVDAKRYRDNLVKDLLLIKKENPKSAYEFLKHEKEGLRYNLAENYQKEVRKNVQGAWIDSKNNEHLKKENQDNKIETRRDLLQKAVELIENNPDIHFMVSANGNILNKRGGETNGQFDYFFDSNNSKEFKQGLPYGNDSRLGMDFFMGGEKMEKLFKEKWKYFRPKNEKRGQKQLPLNVISAKWPHGRIGKLCTEHRPGAHLTMAIAYKNDEIDSLFENINNKELEDLFKCPDNEKGKDFFRDLFSICGHKYFPEYWKEFVSAYNTQTKS